MPHSRRNAASSIASQFVSLEKKCFPMNLLAYLLLQKLATSKYETAGTLLIVKVACSNFKNFFGRYLPNRTLQNGAIPT